MKELRAITQDMGTKLKALEAPAITFGIDGDVIQIPPKENAAKRTIVKVQLPFPPVGPHASEQQPVALVYNQDRSVHCLVPITDPLRTRMGNTMKGYFHASVDEDTVELDGVAAEQSW